MFTHQTFELSIFQFIMLKSCEFLLKLMGICFDFRCIWLDEWEKNSIEIVLCTFVLITNENFRYFTCHYSSHNESRITNLSSSSQNDTSRLFFVWKEKEKLLLNYNQWPVRIFRFLQSYSSNLVVFCFSLFERSIIYFLFCFFGKFFSQVFSSLIFW